jgi:hypothetical protein
MVVAPSRRWLRQCVAWLHGPALSSCRLVQIPRCSSLLTSLPYSTDFSRVRWGTESKACIIFSGVAPRKVNETNAEGLVGRKRIRNRIASKFFVKQAISDDQIWPCYVRTSSCCPLSPRAPPWRFIGRRPGACIVTRDRKCCADGVEGFVIPSRDISANDRNGVR